MYAWCFWGMDGRMGLHICLALLGMFWVHLIARVLFALGDGDVVLQVVHNHFYGLS